MTYARLHLQEDFNKYGIILDVDGNGWSNRFAMLAHYNTPILKQARCACWDKLGRDTTWSVSATQLIVVLAVLRSCAQHCAKPVALCSLRILQGNTQHGFCIRLQRL
jgi:hypothetical protein